MKTRTCVCPRCPETFSNAVKRAQHVTAQHPRSRTRDAAAPRATRPDDAALRRPTDTHPHRP